MGKRYLSPINTKSMVQIVIDRISGAIIAVSYTHLDVYKRQERE